MLATLALLVLAGCGGSGSQQPDADASPSAAATPDPTGTPTPTDAGTPGDDECGAQAFLAPACGALWGVYTLEGEDPEVAIYDLEEEVGRKFDVTMRYHDFSDHPLQGQFPDAFERAAGQTRIPFFSWQARVSDTDTDLAWRDVAEGRYDEEFVRPAARRVADYGDPVFLAFDPEFDRMTSTKGPVEDYVAAYRHVWEVFAEEGVENVAWAWVPTGYLGEDNEETMLEGYPGDEYVDWVGYDPYNFYECNGTEWETFEETIAPGYEWLQGNGLGDKPIILSEYGTQYDADDPARSLQWHRDIPGVLQQYPNLKGLVRFDAEGVFYGGGSFSGTECDLYIDNGPGMIESFRTAGLDPYVNTRD